MKERLLYREGPAALLANVALDEECPPGFGRCKSGKLYLADRELIYAQMHEMWPSKPIKRAKKPE